MIEQIKNIECEFKGLIPHMIVAYYLFNNNEKDAIEYLNNLVKNGILKYLNGLYPNNQYYRFIDDSIKTDCNNCKNNNCMKIVAING
jgi:hypothetical protein